MTLCLVLGGINIKKIIIISLGTETANSLKSQLSNILKSKVEISYYSIENQIPENIECDLIIFSSEEVKNIVLNNFDIKSNYLVVKRIIQTKHIDSLITLDNNTSVLVVNDTENTCKEVIQQLIDYGLDHLNYFPYYPGINKYESQKIAITPGETSLVPKDVEEVIDIGTREMGIISIMESLINLGYIQEYGELLSKYFFKGVIETTKRYIDITNKSTKLTNILNDTLDNSLEGIIYTNTDNEVIILNKVAIDILGIKREDIIGRNIYNIFKNLEEELTHINNNEVLVSKKEIYNNNSLMGYIIKIETSKMIEELDEQRRIKKNLKNNNAKYTFDNLIGQNINLRKMVELSKNISKNNSTILIQGESGTGKEILAQSIHNNSDRKDRPFIAINFSALSENLIESELFGYEEGAFTGAKKGGKVGLFKKAHKGTIFLDEIGDVPYHFQTKILRVLQEREVIPVGGTTAIPIDVRVIAATNKNLIKEVRDNKFREDLFYRINVMPIYTIPLRERKDDIEILLKYYLRKNKYYNSLEEFLDIRVLSFLKEYDWPGNIRELVNVVEYLINIKGENKVCISDIPLYMIEDYNISEKEIDSSELWILEKIGNYDGIGRRSLSLLANEEGLCLSEGVIRAKLNKMKEEGYIEIKKGAKGTKLLEKGRMLLKN